MNKGQANRPNVPAIQALQQELQDFVTQTEQRLQALASNLSACRQSQTILPTCDQGPEPSSLETAELLDAFEFETEIKLPTPAEDAAAKPQASVAHPDLDATDPLVRLNAIKQRIAARIDQHDGSL